MKAQTEGRLSYYKLFGGSLNEVVGRRRNSDPRPPAPVDVPRLDSLTSLLILPCPVIGPDTGTTPLEPHPSRRVVWGEKEVGWERGRPPSGSGSEGQSDVGHPTPRIKSCLSGR